MKVVGNKRGIVTRKMADTRLMRRAVGQFGADSIEALTIRATLTKVLDDAQNLDSYLVQMGKAAKFLPRLIKALHERDDALQTVLEYGRVRFDKKGMREVYSAMNKGEEFGPQMAAFEFRESLRDGWSPSQAVLIHSPRIAEYSRAGDTSLVLAIADAIKKQRRSPQVFQRSAEAWLLRAWVTLALWTCDGKRMEKRITDAAGVLSQNGVPFQHIPLGSDLDTMARRVRHTLKHGRR